MIDTGVFAFQIFDRLVEMCNAVDIEPHQRLGFAIKEFVLLPILDRMNVEHFDGDVDAIASPPRVKHFALTALPKFIDDLVLLIGNSASQRQ